MSRLPVPFGSEPRGFSSRGLEKARRAQESASLTVFDHTVRAQAMAEMDMADSRAVADATRVALEEEIDLLDHGMRLAGASAAKAELVARHVNSMSNSNNRRLQARFGG
jgi:hypothetical protein